MSTPGKIYSFSYGFGKQDIMTDLDLNMAAEYTFTKGKVTETEANSSQVL